MAGDAPESAEEVLLVGWGDVDAIGHMANTAYLNKAADVRLKFLARHGFTKAEMARQGFVPIALRDEIEYFREFHFHDELRADFTVGGISADARRATWVNQFYRDGTLAARVTTTIAYMNPESRKLVAPPEDFLAALRMLVRGGSAPG